MNFDDFNSAQPGSAIVWGGLHVRRIHIQGGPTSRRYSAWGDCDDDDDGEDGDNDDDYGGHDNNDNDDCCSPPSGKWLNVLKVTPRMPDLKENISKATGSKLLVNICKIYYKLLNIILVNNYYVKIKIRIW